MGVLAIDWVVNTTFKNYRLHYQMLNHTVSNWLPVVLVNSYHYSTCLASNIHLGCLDNPSGPYLINLAIRILQNRLPNSVLNQGAWQLLLFSCPLIIKGSQVCQVWFLFFFLCWLFPITLLSYMCLNASELSSRRICSITSPGLGWGWPVISQASLSCHSWRYM